MALFEASRRQEQQWQFLICTLAVLLAACATAANGMQEKIKVLLVGQSGTFGDEGADPKVEAANDKTLLEFIKEETGFDSETFRQKGWVELADKLTKGKLHLGVFQGYEFAWAQEKHPGLKPLAIAVNVQRYPVACVIVKSDSPAKSFAQLQGQSLGEPRQDNRHVDLFLEHKCKTVGKTPSAFFPNTAKYENLEEMLDNVFDGVKQVAVADEGALEAYQRRKPGRFAKLRVLERSQPFPPPVVVVHNNVLDKTTLKRFQEGLLNASKTPRGQTTLNLFRVNHFEEVPGDFDKVLAATRKTYPMSLSLGK
jgi:ABC-type phosphate/phosphonate transport system substrate-binding protein